VKWKNIVNNTILTMISQFSESEIRQKEEFKIWKKKWI